jgi:MFS family permease
MTDNTQSNYRWYLLGLTVATAAFVSTLPVSCMPVLFKEISEDLSLNLVQIGTVWGVVYLASIFISPFGGLLSDRFGVKSLMGVSCLLVGLTGALRGLSTSFLTLSFTVFLVGVVRTIIPISLTKTIGSWFQGRNLGTAMGISAMGMGIGLSLGPMISATILSPLLGGWRGVMYLYGAVAIAIGILWFLFGREPHQADVLSQDSPAEPFHQAFLRIIRIKALWLMGFTLFFRWGCIQGVTGYLPLYLREQGWSPASADGTLSVLYGVSMICVVPLSSLSDRLGARKAILFAALILTFIGFVLLPFLDGTPVWILIIMAGLFIDAFMSIIVTMLYENNWVPPKDYGAALGFTFAICQVGIVIAPPLGNSLANLNSGLPFLFWAALSSAAFFTLASMKEQSKP